jgi:hypothetical protein
VDEEMIVINADFVMYGAEQLPLIFHEILYLVGSLKIVDPIRILLKSILATMEKNSKFYKLKTMISP